MKQLEKMTRRELAEVIVNNQIERGITRVETKELQIERRLKGCGVLKAQSWTDLYEAAKSMVA